MMTKEGWESLTASSGWPMLKQYLQDVRSAIAEKLARGEVPPVDYPLAVTRCKMVHELASLELVDIQKFYGVEPKQEEDDES